MNEQKVPDNNHEITGMQPASMAQFLSLVRTFLIIATAALSILFLVFVLPFITGFVLAKPYSIALKIGLLSIYVGLATWLVRNRFPELKRHEKRLSRKLLTLIMFEIAVGLIFAISDYPIDIKVLGVTIFEFLVIWTVGSSPDMIQSIRNVDSTEITKQLSIKVLKAGRTTFIILGIMAPGFILVTNGFPGDSPVIFASFILAWVILIIGILPEMAPGYAYVCVQSGTKLCSVALWISDTGLRFNSKEPFCLLTKGASYIGLKRYEEAEHICTLAINEFPDFFENYVNRGYARYKLNKLSQAEEDFSKAIELKPECMFAFLCRSLVRKNGECEDSTEKALEDTNRAIELAPSFYLTYFMRARVYQKMNRPEAYLNDMQEYLKLLKVNNYQQSICCLMETVIIKRDVYKFEPEDS